jgi:hypothetical protein
LEEPLATGDNILYAVGQAELLWQGTVKSLFPKVINVAELRIQKKQTISYTVDKSMTALSRNKVS